MIRHEQIQGKTSQSKGKQAKEDAEKQNDVVSWIGGNVV